MSFHPEVKGCHWALQKKSLPMTVKMNFFVPYCSHNRRKRFYVAEESQNSELWSQNSCFLKLKKFPPVIYLFCFNMLCFNMLKMIRGLYISSGTTCSLNVLWPVIYRSPLPPPVGKPWWKFLFMIRSTDLDLKEVAQCQAAENRRKNLPGCCDVFSRLLRPSQQHLAAPLQQFLTWKFSFKYPDAKKCTLHTNNKFGPCWMWYWPLAGISKFFRPYCFWTRDFLPTLIWH